MTTASPPSAKKIRPSGRGGGAPSLKKSSDKLSSQVRYSPTLAKPATGPSEPASADLGGFGRRKGLRKTASIASISSQIIRGISPKRSERNGRDKSPAAASIRSLSTVRAARRSLDDPCLARDAAASGVTAVGSFYQPLESVYHSSPTSSPIAPEASSSTAPSAAETGAFHKSHGDKSRFRNVFHGHGHASTSHREPQKKVNKSALSWSELTEADFHGTSRQPLPVRLGLVPPFPADGSHDRITPPSKYRGRTGVKGSRYVDGYYLHLAPASLARPPESKSPLMNLANDSFSDTASLFSQPGSMALDLAASRLSLPLNDSASVMGRRMSLQGQTSMSNIKRSQTNSSTNSAPGPTPRKKVIPSGRGYVASGANRATAPVKEMPDDANLTSTLEDDVIDPTAMLPLDVIRSRASGLSSPPNGLESGWGQAPMWSEYNFGSTKPSLSRADTVSSGRPASTKDEWYLEDYWNNREVRSSNGGKRLVRYHGFPSSAVPYFLSHDAYALACEMCLHWIMSDTLSQRHSIIPFVEKKPARILDLGTGTGAWCIDVAKEWKDSEIIGLDVVPCQTPLANLKDPDLSRRISWVVANFLEELPFPTDSFDFVHARFIGATSLREDQWPAFLSEISRILKPTGHFELIDRNSNFLGNVTYATHAELSRILMGKGTTAAQAGPVPHPPPQYEDLLDAFMRTLSRRFINPSALSILGSALVTQDFRDVRTGVPRRMPISVDPRDVAMLARRSAPGQPPIEEMRKPGQPDLSAHIGRPLTEDGFDIHEIGVIRSLAILSQANRNDCCVDLTWEEADEEKRQLMSKSVGPVGDAASRLNTTVHDVQRTASWAHPWNSRTDFDRQTKKLHEALWTSADMASHLRDILGWKEGTLESVDARKTAERQRKLNMGVSKTEDAFAGSFDALSKDSLFVKPRSRAQTASVIPPPTLPEEEDELTATLIQRKHSSLGSPTEELQAISPTLSGPSGDESSPTESSGPSEYPYDSADGLTPPLVKPTLSGTSSRSYSSSSASDDDLPSPTSEGHVSHPLMINLSASSYGEPLMDGQTISLSASQEGDPKHGSDMERLPSFFITPQDRYAAPLRRAYSSQDALESSDWNTVTAHTPTSPTSAQTESLLQTPRGSTAGVVLPGSDLSASLQTPVSVLSKASPAVVEKVDDAVLYGYVPIYGFSETSAFLARGPAPVVQQETKVLLSSWNFGSKALHGGGGGGAGANAGHGTAVGGGNASSQGNNVPRRMKFRNSASSLGSLPETQA